jgi:hypothetical protein
MFCDICPGETAFFSIHFVLAFSADRAYHFGKDEVRILIVLGLRGETDHEDYL